MRSACSVAWREYSEPSTGTRILAIRRPASISALLATAVSAALETLHLEERLALLLLQRAFDEPNRVAIFRNEDVLQGVDLAFGLLQFGGETPARYLDLRH